MGIKQTARNIGALRDPAVVLPDVGERQECIVDSGQNLVWVGLHNVGSETKPVWRNCRARSNRSHHCDQCDQGTYLRERWTARVDVYDINGELEPRLLWLTARDVGRIASVLPDAGSVIVEITRVDDERPDSDGKTWQHTEFALV